MTDDHTGKWQSGAITDGPSRAGARAMLRTLGTYASWKSHEGQHTDPFEVMS